MVFIFSRPGGAEFFLAANPQLKLRAIFKSAVGAAESIYGGGSFNFGSTRVRGGNRVVEMKTEIGCKPIWPT